MSWNAPLGPRFTLFDMTLRPVQRALARYPSFYSNLLKWIRRGTIEKRLFLALIRRGNVVCDIGANRGDYALLFSDIVGLQGQVHAFEPVPTTFELLKSKFRNNGCIRNFWLNNVALGESVGAVTVHQPGTDDGQASLRTHSHGSWSKHQEVFEHQCEMTTLDIYSAAFTRLDFIKCDVEGSEMLVLKGATKAISRFSPILFVEVFEEWTEAFGYRPEDLLKFLRGLGYDTFFMCNDRVTKIDPGCSTISESGNLICGKQSHLCDVLEA